MDRGMQHQVQLSVGPAAGHSRLPDSKHGIVEGLCRVIAGRAKNLPTGMQCAHLVM